MCRQRAAGRAGATMSARKAKRSAKKAAPTLTPEIVREIVGRRIDTERRRLQQAHAILICAVTAAMEDVEVDYSDVMRVVSDMIEAAVDQLDSVVLGRPKRNEVEEDAL